MAGQVVVIDREIVREYLSYVGSRIGDDVADEDAQTELQEVIGNARCLVLAFGSDEWEAREGVREGDRGEERGAE